MAVLALPRNESDISESPTSHARDYGAVIAIILTIIFYHVTDAALRESTPLGLAFRNAALRRVLWVLWAGTAAALVAAVVQGRTLRSMTRQVIDATAAFSLMLAVLNAGLFVFAGRGVTLAAPLTTLIAIASVCAALVLAAPWERGRLWRRTGRQTAPALLIAFGVLLVWELIITVFNVKQFLLPRPTVISQTLFETFPDLISKSWVTFQNALWGYAIGCGLGVLIGVASARFSAFSRAILPFAIAANSTPIIAFAPIMGFWFGVTQPASKIAVVAIMVFFPCMINTVRGLLAADRGALELMRSLATGEIAIFRKVRFPAALPFIFNGLKFGTTWSVIGAVVAEFFGGTTQGIGYYIRNKPTAFDFAAAWAAIVIVSLLGILFYTIVSLVERIVMPWHVSFREKSA